MASTGEKVWGLHRFHAENADEVSFDVGETILVVEKDDAYGDGWWQGTNEKGQTGLFPFSYATTNQELAENARALSLSAGEASVQSNAPPGVMNSTMADVDQALTELRGGPAGDRGDPAADRTRKSFQSERTADYSAADDETDNDEDEYQARTNARAALAAKAKANAAQQLQKDKEDQDRMRLHAKKVFEEEEARHRELLLRKEEEFKAAAAKGELPASTDKPKVAPIEGVDMSDDSDSEASANGFDSYPTQQANVSDPKTTDQAQVQSTKPATDRLAIDESEREHIRDADVKDELDDVPGTKAHAEQRGTPSSSAKPAGLAAGGAALAAGAAAAAPHTASSANSQRGPSFDSTKQREQSIDQQSVTGSTRPSHTDTASLTGTGTHTAATSVGRETPKSINASFPGPSESPAPSASQLNRPAAPGGDPQDWSVDNVVEWARSKGWDENSIVSKFQEHEISGDVLLEMDVNILKEIDIIAFGKRFQVANAIKELKGQGGLSPSAGLAGSPSTGRIVSSGGQSHTSGDSQPAAAASPAAAAAAGAGAFSGIGLGVPSANVTDVDTAAATRAASYDTGTVIQHGSPGTPRDRDITGSSMPPLGSANGSQSMSLSAMADASLINRSGNNFSPPPQQAAGSTSSPRKRTSKVSGTGERSSFFAGFNPRQRKPPAMTPGGTPAIVEEENKPNKGTLSRFGLNRLGRGAHGSGDFKNQISLPTSSPTYDSEGDTARRNRASATSTGSTNQMAGRALGGYDAAVGGGHGRQASIGSAGPGEHKGEESFSVDDPQNGSGPVISRIRPVDVEGWMRKKGERYNVWKPRYLALKGSDLVILRDPQAPKIKGYVSMKGYKVIADENTNPGKYGFKILHETEKPHYFSSDDPVLVREWMKGLMKATIGRDPSFPVISSYNNATISLKEAQSMYPPPRPPSPASRLRTQRAKARENPGELTAKDAAVLMGISQPQKEQAGMHHADYPSRPDNGYASDSTSDRIPTQPPSSGAWSSHWRKKSFAGLAGLGVPDKETQMSIYRPVSVVLDEQEFPRGYSMDGSKNRMPLLVDVVGNASGISGKMAGGIVAEKHRRSRSPVRSSEDYIKNRSGSQSTMFRWTRPSGASAPRAVSRVLAKMKSVRPGTAESRSRSNSCSHDSPTQEKLLDSPMTPPPMLADGGFFRAVTPDVYDRSSSSRGQVKHWIRTAPDTTPPLNIIKLSSEYERSRIQRQHRRSVSTDREGSTAHVREGAEEASGCGSAQARHRRNRSGSFADVLEGNEARARSPSIQAPTVATSATSGSSRAVPWGLTKYEKILGLVPGPPPSEDELRQQQQQQQQEQRRTSPRGPLPTAPVTLQPDDVVSIMNGQAIPLLSRASSGGRSRYVSDAQPRSAGLLSSGFPSSPTAVNGPSPGGILKNARESSRATDAAPGQPSPPTATYFLPIAGLSFEDDGHGLPRARSTSDLRPSRSGTPTGPQSATMAGAQRLRTSLRRPSGPRQPSREGGLGGGALRPLMTLQPSGGGNGERLGAEEERMVMSDPVPCPTATKSNSPAAVSVIPTRQLYLDAQDSPRGAGVESRGSQHSIPGDEAVPR